MGLFDRKAKEAAERIVYDNNIGYDSLPPLPPPPMPMFNPNDGIPLGMGMEKDTTRELAEYITSTKDLIEQLENQLRGRKVYDEYDYTSQSIKKVIEDVGEPMMNNLGIQRYIGFLASMVSKNSIMSNLMSDFLHKLMIEENEIITKHVCSNKRRYEIRDTDLQLIISLGEDLVYTCMSRGVDRGEGQLVLKGRREVVNRNIDDAALRAMQGQNQSLWRQFGGTANR